MATRGASQPAVLFSNIKSAPATSHMSAINIFLSQQISTCHQPPASQTSWTIQSRLHRVRSTRKYGTVALRHHGGTRALKAIRTHGPLYSSSIRPSQQDSLLHTQFFRTHPSSISSSIHSIHCGTHLSLYLNISMCDLVLKDLLRQI
jgi:hypothetical protein